jgi:hypothetical protein
MEHSTMGTVSHMVTRRTIEEVTAAGKAEGANDPPLSQEAADRVAAILLASGHWSPAAPDRTERRRRELVTRLGPSGRRAPA